VQWAASDVLFSNINCTSRTCRVSALLTCVIKLVGMENLITTQENSEWKG